MPKAKRVALTGGGTAGHVMPNVALLPAFRNNGWEVFYIGSVGIEKKIITAQGVSFHQITSGKLRRYFSFKNFVDVFKIFLGLVQSLMILLLKRPKVLFSKGGYVSVPVAYAAFLLRIPVISHESDLTPGLATKLIKPIASKIFYTFAESKKFLPMANAVYVGNPMRDELRAGDKVRGRAFCGFPGDLKEPVILVMGGSLGAKAINEALLKSLPDLVKCYYVIHITGQGKGIDFHHPKYKAFDYVGKELPDLFAATDLVIARAGANSIFEYLNLQIPMLLIPLVAGSRGDQVDNAKVFADHGWAMVLPEKELTRENLTSKVEQLARSTEAMKERQRAANLPQTKELIIREIAAFM
jgi:UDP-N-acetylglucosamine--N-acetylmuramyl-(pentapeptide) pyrophosphoryl-undecaprenol N-acetylglucosamine transferase